MLYRMSVPSRRSQPSVAQGLLTNLDRRKSLVALIGLRPSTESTAASMPSGLMVSSGDPNKSRTVGW